MLYRKDKVTGPDYCVVLFQSTSGAIRGEKLAKEAGLAVKLIPVPRHLSSDCGLCLRCESVDARTLRSLLETAEIQFEDVVRV